MANRDFSLSEDISLLEFCNIWPELAGASNITLIRLANKETLNVIRAARARMTCVFEGDRRRSRVFISIS